MQDTPDAMPDLPPSLRLLKGLVMVLMVTMIVGVITVVYLLVTRMPDGNATPSLPAGLTLPQGTTAEAVTFGKGWIAVVTTDQRILIFDSSGVLKQEISLNQSAAP